LARGIRGIPLFPHSSALKHNMIIFPFKVLLYTVLRKN
jgi:hypothetical protein